MHAPAAAIARMGARRASQRASLARKLLKRFPSSGLAERSSRPQRAGVECIPSRPESGGGVSGEALARFQYRIADRAQSVLSGEVNDRWPKRNEVVHEHLPNSSFNLL